MVALPRVLGASLCKHACMLPPHYDISYLREPDSRQKNSTGNDLQFPVLGQFFLPGGTTFLLYYTVAVSRIMSNALTISAYIDGVTFASHYVMYSHKKRAIVNFKCVRSLGVVTGEAIELIYQPFHTVIPPSSFSHPHPLMRNSGQRSSTLEEQASRDREEFCESTSHNVTQM